MGFNKNAVIGGFITTFIATIVIITILIIFIIASGIVKTFSENYEGEKVEKKLDETGMNNYMYNFWGLKYARTLIERGQDISQSVKNSNQAVSEKKLKEENEQRKANSWYYDENLPGGGIVAG